MRVEAFGANAVRFPIRVEASAAAWQRVFGIRDDELLTLLASRFFAFDASRTRELEAVSGNHSYGCAMVMLPDPYARRVLELIQSIPDDLSAGAGREDEPHVTVLYGIAAKTGEAISALQRLAEPMGPLFLRFGRISVFPYRENVEANPEAAYDVLKIDVDAPQLHTLNRGIKTALPVVSKFPTYNPHMTLAYVKPGSCDTMLGSDLLAGTVEVDKFVYSPPQGSRVIIDVGPRAIVGEESPEQI